MRWAKRCIPTFPALSSKLNKILDSSLLTFCTNHQVALAVRCAPGHALIWAERLPLARIQAREPPFRQRLPQRPGPPYPTHAWASSWGCLGRSRSPGRTCGRRRPWRYRSPSSAPRCPASAWLAGSGTRWSPGRSTVPVRRRSHRDPLATGTSGRGTASPARRSGGWWRRCATCASSSAAACSRRCPSGIYLKWEWR